MVDKAIEIAKALIKQKTRNEGQKISLGQS